MIKFLARRDVPWKVNAAAALFNTVLFSFTPSLIIFVCILISGGQALLYYRMMVNDERKDQEHEDTWAEFYQKYPFIKDDE